MKNKLAPGLIILVLAGRIFASGYSFYAEGAYAYPLYSDISIPRSKVNEFSLTDDLSADGKIAYRLELKHEINERHKLELMVAPLSITASGILPKDIEFNGRTFSKGDEAQALFRFDSYRIRYRYFFRNKAAHFKSIGLTGKLRDAEIKLKTSTEESRKLNTGVVPLINFLFIFPLSEKLELSINGDAAFSPYGRAEDIFTGFVYSANRHLSIYSGYRVVEGGSDVAEVYSFTWINYFVIGLEYRL